ncbi:Hypp9634 [Branchiostoma lanceolatum]|uniref:1-alkyl-2-acetylglycerophosphocholine esterase n=1 Tax=Branchiostoma lanceolatum TaxID=7740 RepID=A0A8S4MNI4_BRALA|nr:Hypp9634 [Branchiostoma lanceolatum]
MPRPLWSPNLYTTPSVLEKLSEEDVTPNTIVLHVGTNDVMAKSKETVISEFEMAVSTAQSLFPDAELVISVVPPRRNSSFRPNVNSDITAINQHLQNLSETNAQLTYVSHPQLWSNNDYSSSVFEHDGYHLNGDGVRVIAFNLKRQASGTLGLPPRRSSYKSKANPGNDTSPQWNKRRRDSYSRSDWSDRPLPRSNDSLTKSPSPRNVNMANSGKPYSQYNAGPNPTRRPQHEVFHKGSSNAANGRGNGIAPPMRPNGPAAPAPPPMFYPNYQNNPWHQQEWPSPIEAYGRPAVAENIRPPNWYGPPPFPFRMDRSWHGRPDSLFGYNERPHGSF